MSVTVIGHVDGYNAQGALDIPESVSYRDFWRVYVAQNIGIIKIVYSALSEDVKTAFPEE